MGSIVLGFAHRCGIGLCQQERKANQIGQRTKCFGLVGVG